jgi:hypothetical protein
MAALSIVSLWNKGVVESAKDSSEVESKNVARGKIIN